MDDVVNVTLSALFGISCGTYQIAGLEAISYNRLVDLVGAAVGTDPVKIHVPAKFCALVLELAERIGLRLSIDREQVLRLQEDKSVSIEAAVRDLDFAPLGFEEALAMIHAADRKSVV